MSCSRKSSISAWLTRAMIVAGLIGGAFPGGEPSSVFAQIFRGSKAEPGSSRPHVIVQQTAAHNWFTVMGEVRYPQTYELPTGSPSVVEFLRFASSGWPTPLSPNASGQLRIIRAGREVQKLYYSDSLSFTLMPGDIVIADVKFGQGQAFQGQPNETLQASQTVKIALIGVLDHPFIMAAPPDLATTDWIARQLGQDPAIAKTAIRLLPRGSHGADASTKLPDNSVVQFKQGQIDVSKLPPNLPRPFRAGVDQRPIAPVPTQPDVSDEVALNPPGRAFVPSAPPPYQPVPPRVAPDQFSYKDNGSVQLDPERPDLPVRRRDVVDPRNPEGRARVSQGMPEPKRFTPPAGAASVTVSPSQDELDSRPSAQARKPFGDSEPADDSAEGTSGEAGTPRDHQSRKVSDLPMKPVPEKGSAAGEGTFSTVVSEPDFNARIGADGSLSIQGANSAPAMQGQFPTLAKQAPTEADDALNEAKSDVATTASSPDWSGIAIILLTSLGLGGLCWFALSLGRGAPNASHVVIQRPARDVEPSKTRLVDRLINNELPVETEPARLPADLRIHGRPANKPRLRVDAGHTSGPKPPHFNPRRLQADVVQEADVAVDADQVGLRELDLPPQSDSNDEDAPVTERASSRKLRFDAAPAVAATGKQPAASKVRAPRGLRSFIPDDADEISEVKEVPVTRQVVAARSAVTEPNSAADPRVQPSRVITEGGDIVDRALEAFYQAKGQP